MKLTKSTLKQIIKEEIKAIISEVSFGLGNPNAAEGQPLARVAATQDTDISDRPEDTDINNKLVTAIDLLGRAGDQKYEETIELVRQAQIAYQQALRKN